MESRRRLLHEEATKIDLEICRENEQQAEMMEEIRILQTRLERSKQFVLYKTQKLQQVTETMNEVYETRAAQAWHHNA